VLVVVISDALRIENISEHGDIKTDSIHDILKNVEDLSEYVEDIPEYVEDIPEHVEGIPEHVEGIPEHVEDLPKQNSVVGHNYQAPPGGSLMLYSLQALLETEDGSDS